MPAFFILQGAPASGKSTFIHDNALDDYTVSSDEIRIELNGIGTDDDGNPCIPQDNQQLVWRTVENRLRNAIDSRSPVVVLDAMNGVVYRDDKEVTRTQVSRHYAETDHLAVKVSWNERGEAL